ncbi:MAG: hypothetical protein ACRDT5_07965 [Mycobacterium sp.]
MATPIAPAEKKQRSTPVRAAREFLFDTLLGDRAELAGRVRETIQAHLPAYRAMPALCSTMKSGFRSSRSCGPRTLDARR